MKMQDLSRRRLFGLGLGAGSAALLSACGGGGGPRAGGAARATAAATTYNGPDVALTFWNGFTGGDGPVMKKLIDQFNTENPKIKITMNVYKWEEYYQKLPAAVATGKGPDLAIMHVDSVATNAARRVILPLDDVAKSLALTEADFSPPVWKAGIFRGSRYGIPLDVHPLGLFYNKKVLEDAGLDPDKPPATGTEYMAALETLKGKGVQGHWATPFPFTGLFQFWSLIHQFGGAPFAPDASRATFADPPGVQAMTWLADLVNKGYSPKDVGQDADVIALQNGKTAFNWNGIWTINTLREAKDLEWGVAPLPQIGSKPSTWAGSHQFVIPRPATEDQNKLTAGKVFINWLSQHSLEWAKGGQVPARKAIRDSAGFKALPEQAALGKAIDTVAFPPATPGIQEAIKEMETALNQAVLLKKPPQQALSEAAGRANKILEANRKKYGG
jgi:multiple sugar transport system substrate-binding protein